jgi:hypothetical protein
MSAISLYWTTAPLVGSDHSAALPSWLQNYLETAFGLSPSINLSRKAQRTALLYLHFYMSNSGGAVLQKVAVYTSCVSVP